MKFTGLENSKIILRALEPGDLEDLYRWENDSRYWVYGNTLAPYSVFTLDEFIKTASYDVLVNKQIRLMIQEKKSGAAIGAVDLFDIDFVHRRAGIGILIDSIFQRKGYALSTLGLVSGYAFGMLNLHQLFCHITEDNTQSRKLFEKDGYVKTGRLKQWILSSGKWSDVLIYQKLNKS